MGRWLDRCHHWFTLQGRSPNPRDVWAWAKPCRARLGHRSQSLSCAHVQHVKFNMHETELMIFLWNIFWNIFWHLTEWCLLFHSDMIWCCSALKIAADGWSLSAGIQKAPCITMPCSAMLRHEARDANDEQREQRLSSVLCSSGGEDHMIMEDPNISPDGPDGHLDIQNLKWTQLALEASSEASSEALTSLLTCLTWPPVSSVSYELLWITKWIKSLIFSEAYAMRPAAMPQVWFFGHSDHRDHRDLWDFGSHAVGRFRGPRSGGSDPTGHSCCARGICWNGELVVATLLRDLGQDSIKQCQVVIREKPEVREREKVVEAHPKWVVRVVRVVPATSCYSRCSWGWCHLQTQEILWLIFSHVNHDEYVNE